jgi:hypothetical protein
LIATVSYPLRRMYGDQFALAPLSVLVDPVRAEQVFGLREGRKFSEKVLYIWRKQVEEADLIVIGKVDLLDAGRLETLRDRLATEFPGKPIIEISAREGRGLKEWFEILENAAPASREAMEIDYDIYADGEALLGWLNATVDVRSPEGIDASKLLQALADGMRGELADAEIAHLKMTLSPDDALAGEIAALSLVRSDYISELGMKLDEPVTSGQLIVNCRAEAAPATLRAALEKTLTGLRREFPELSAKLEHAEQFRPGRPNPTHRLERPEALPT